GVQTVDYTEPDEKLPQTGIIALQIHGGGKLIVRYKEFTIKELPVSPKPSAPKAELTPVELSYDAKLVQDLANDAASRGNAHHGAAVISLPTVACMSCHKIGAQGGTVGPDLSEVGKRLSSQEIIEHVLWPKRKVRPEYIPILVITTDGEDFEGYKESE